MTEEHYRVENQQPVQGQVVGEHNMVHQHYYSGSPHGVSGSGKTERGSSVDVCVVCALAEEVEAFLRVAQRQEKVQITREAQYGYYLVQLENAKGETLRIHLSWPSRYGPHEMMLHAKQMMGDNQPRLAVMMGFCAGDKRQVYLGDLVVAERTFFSDTGSMRKDEQGQQVHEHDVITYNMPEQVLRYVRLFQEWKPLVASLVRPVSKRGQRDWLLERLSQEPTGSLTAIAHSELELHAPAWRSIVQALQQGPEPWLLPTLAVREKERIEHLRYGADPFPWHDPTEARCHIQALASGSAVRRDAPFQEVQIPVRGAIGIDMEGAAFGRVMQGFPKIGWLVVKGVADYADQEKDDTYHAYAAEAAACYALSLMQHYVTQERLPRLEENLPASRDGPKRVWMMPYTRNPFFTGRDAVLSDLHQRFQRGQTQAVSQPQAMSGLGGIGKTQSAVEYAHRYAQEYEAVLWVRADSHENLVSGYVAIAHELELWEQDEQEQAVIVQAVKRWLTTTQRRWLLILDNADELAVVRDFLSSKYGGHLLLTTRAQATGKLAHRIEVEIMDKAQGALLLLRRAGLVTADGVVKGALPGDVTVAKQITEELGGLPLALDQAGAYIEETQCGLVDYVDLYHARSAELLRKRGGLVGEDDHPKPVAATWSLSFQKVEAENPAAAELLRFCAYLAPDAIPEEILVKGAEHLGSVLSTIVGDALQLNEAIRVLGAYSLVRRESSGISVHRLVQAVLQDGMEEETKRVWRERVIRAVAVSVPDVEYEQWNHWEGMVLQALRCAEYLKQGDSAPLNDAQLLHQTGAYLLERGRYREADPLLHQALELREQHRGREHLETAQTIDRVARLYEVQGKYSEAEPLYARVLAICEQSLEPTHPTMARSVNNLGMLYKEQGKYIEAEPLLKRALAIREESLGPGHPDTMESVNNLGTLYYAQGKYIEAESLLERALEICEQELGPEHPSTASSLNNLAMLYREQEKYVEAEPLYTRALAIYEQSLGPGHLNTATGLNNLAEFYKEQGRHIEVEPLLKRALAIYEQVQGPTHPNTANSLNNLAGFYYMQGEYADAEPLFLRALTIQERESGPMHPATAVSLNNVAMLYLAQEKYVEAESLLVRVLKILEQSVGAEHPNTKIGRGNYARLLRALGREEEAAALEAQGE